MDLINQSLEIARNPKHTRWIYPLLLIADAGLCGYILEKIPCT
jgi:alpha-1,3-mannosyltransferase